MDPRTHGLMNVGPVHAQLAPARWIELALARKEGVLANNGAFVANTVPYTGRSAKDKYLVRRPANETQIAVVWDCLFTIGLSLCGRGDGGSGISLVSATQHMWQVSGVAVAEDPSVQAALGRVEKGARAALGDDGYEAAVNAGEALTRDEAIALGLSIAPD